MVQPDLSKLQQHCEDPSSDPRFCAFGDAAEASPDSEDRGGPVVRDDRIKKLALIAPVGALFGEGALDNVTSDILLVRAGKDQILSAPHHAENIHRLLMRDHVYETLDDMHHFGFIEPFPWYLKPFGFEASKDPENYQRRRNLDLLNDKIAKFMADRLD